MIVLNILYKDLICYNFWKKKIKKYMQKHLWHRVHLNIQSSVTPVPRWGHSCCVVDDEVVFFGGYAESIYMNDVWSFNTTTMEWNEVKTHGDVPSQRSNCSINYDENTKRVVIFGGGGPNKQRFNTINILDWVTKEWLEIAPKEHEPAPEERTYHASELMYPYLVVFGGEGVCDMDDLWVFNFLTLSWKEIHIDQEKPKPCARRFHSSALINNQFLIIAGCHGKYRCLKDVYSLDLTPLFNSENYSELEWVERKPTGSAFLTRWGHSSAVYDNKVYIFGGRFSNDLNDVLVLDIEKNSLKALKTATDLPKARRRHSACFFGSCMIIFGGFNGEYFNDLHYINVFELKTKLQAQPHAGLSSTKFFNTKMFSDAVIKTSTGENFYLHKGFVINGFKSVEDMEEFLQDIDGKWTKEDIISTMMKFYEGYGGIDDDLKRTYRIKLPETSTDRDEVIKELIYGEERQFPKRPTLLKKELNSVIEVTDQTFSQFLDRNRDETYNDLTIRVNEIYSIGSNRTLLASRSKFFHHLLSKKFLENNYIILKGLNTDIVIFEIMINYLLLDLVVVPEDMGYRNWIQLFQIAQYFALEKLMKICEQQICFRITEDSCNKIFQFGLKSRIEAISLSCADFIIRCMASKENKFQLEEAEKIKQKDQCLQKMYNLSKFDILQTRLHKIKLNKTFKRENQCNLEEKENYELS